MQIVISRVAGAGSLILLMAFVTGFSPEAKAGPDCRKNPDHPTCPSDGGGSGEPPSQPPNNTCVDVEGKFPAIAYTTSVTTGKRRKAVTTTRLHLADSTGACSIEVWSSDNTSLDLQSISFAKVDDSLARLALGTSVSGDEYAVRMFEIELDGKAIVTALPLQPTTVHSIAVGSLGSVEISNDGSTIVFGTEEPGSGQGEWLDTLRWIDISACQSDCPAETIRTADDESFEWISISDDKQRVFYSTHKRVPDTYHVSMVQSLDSSWSDPIDVVSSVDVGYTAAKFHDTSLTRWDQGEVLSISVELTQNSDYVLDLVNVEVVSTNVSGMSCFSASDCSHIATDLLDGVSFYQANFISDESNPSRILIGTWPTENPGQALELNASVPEPTPLLPGNVEWVVPAR